ncbi:diguanylate cyclase with PAS/PAC sensor [Desulfuromonas soudanensis]|uniref:Diguanylate cyclase with PAS/PAC sensor n=1 Tax=Desulfuromonas soudanensis TaxID=1603606 RepID=A0A0M3QG91_9BACT|nr:sensor domain-containing diguanylate cyclase [Desulfuromonas soudanensis]ALC17403.1 diguanylate cyclase with PAS/PAC sensor [Desulfuromonas soudanensis]
MINSHDLYRELLEQIHDGVYFVDTERRILFWNRGVERLTGFGRNEVMNHFCHDNLLRHVDGNGTFLCQDGCPLQKTIEDGQSREAEVFLHHKDGHRVPVHVRVTPVRNAAGVITGAVELFNDNSFRHSYNERIRELEDLALLDPLTRLANRRFLEDHLEQQIKEIDRYKLSIGLVFLDIDHFKQFNDRYGHDCGDLVLKTVARTLSGNGRAFDVFGRWGGEEFIGVLRNIDGDALRHAAEKFRTLIATSSVPWQGEALSVTASFGATLLTDEDTPSSGLQRVDRLMYLSKEGGRNRVTFG